jgi:hypothetical protein
MPSAFEVAVWVTLVARFVAVILTPLTTACEESSMVPLITLVFDCAKTAGTKDLTQVGLI